MKNLILIIAAILVSFTSFSQSQKEQIFKLYSPHNPVEDVHPNKKVCYTSLIDQKQTAQFYSYYTYEGIDLIVEEANRILSIYNADKSEYFKRSDFLGKDGLFDASKGDFMVYTVTFSDGSYMKVGAMDNDEYVADWGYVKVMEVTFKQGEN